MMRRNVKVYTTCDAHLPDGSKYVAVHLLTLETLYFVVDIKSKVNELFIRVCKYLGLSEAQLFGLSIFDKDDCGFIFLDPSLKLSKYAPKQWKTLKNGLDNTGKSMFGVHLRVQLYVDSYLFISDKVAKVFYYLQLRENVVNYGQILSEEKAFLLASFALQADFGNFNSEKHENGLYFNPQLYFPSWVIEQMGCDYIVRHLPFLHRDLKGIPKVEAQTMFIKEASDSTSPHNLHFYKLKSKKATTTSCYNDVWLGICANGVEIYTQERRNNTKISKAISKTNQYDSNISCNQQAESLQQKSRLSIFTWPDIGKLFFEKKKFEIQSIGYPIRKFTYMTQSEDMARHLLWLCKVTHQFQLVMQSKMNEVKRRETELSRKKFRESYIYSDSYELPIIGRNKKLVDSMSADCSLPCVDETHSQTTNSTDNSRVSVMSNASSNTTSGIVSDKVQSLDDSDRDDIDMEIMVNAVQVQVTSLESLASSHTIANTNDNPSSYYKTVHEKSSDEYNSMDNHINSLSKSHASMMPEVITHERSQLPLNHQEFGSSANSSKSASSEQSIATIKSVIPRLNENKPLEKANKSINSQTVTTQIPFQQTFSEPRLCVVEKIPVHETKSTPSLFQHGIFTDDCAKLTSQTQHVAMKQLRISNLSRLPQRSESMNHIYENIPYFSKYQANQTIAHLRHDDDSPPPLPASAPPRNTTRIGVSSLTRVHKPLSICQNSNAYHVAGSEPNLSSTSASQPRLLPPSYFNLTDAEYTGVSPFMNTWCGNDNDISSYYTRSSDHIGYNNQHAIKNIQQTHLNHSNFESDINNTLNSFQKLKLHNSKDTRAHSDPTRLSSGFYNAAQTQLNSPFNYHIANSHRTNEQSQHHQQNNNSNCIPQSFHQSLNDIAKSSALTIQVPLRLVGSDVAINDSVIDSSVHNLVPAHYLHNPYQQENQAFIPPPLDFANSSLITINSNNHSIESASSQSPQNTSQKKVNGILKNKSCISYGKENLNPLIGDQSSDHNNSITDLNQLRHSSQDLDIPLINALFNDRSLMMLPKTVATCSRQRHVGNGRDVRRFSCSSYEEENNNDKTMKGYLNGTPTSSLLLPNTKLSCSKQDSVPSIINSMPPNLNPLTSSSRPNSWHLELPENNSNMFVSAYSPSSTADFIERIWAEHELST